MTAAAVRRRPALTLALSRRERGPALHLAGRDEPGEVGERAVVGPLRVRRETTARQLLAPEVVSQALAAQPLARARVVGAGAASRFWVFLQSMGNSFYRHPWASQHSAPMKPGMRITECKMKNEKCKMQNGRCPRHSAISNLHFSFFIFHFALCPLPSAPQSAGTHRPRAQARSVIHALPHDDRQRLGGLHGREDVLRSHTPCPR